MKAHRMSESQLTFKEMCTRFDVTPRTLRYYEYIELLTPEKEGRTRSYGPREVARMVLILRGRRFGFSLEGIRQWLEIYEQKGDKAQLEVWVEMADGQLDELKVQHQQLGESISELQQLRNEAAETIKHTK